MDGKGAVGKFCVSQHCIALFFQSSLLAHPPFTTETHTSGALVEGVGMIITTLKAGVFSDMDLFRGQSVGGY